MATYEQFNAETAAGRLAALRAYVASSPALPAATEEVNNHIHTFYSFSPYSPTLAALKARQAGLKAAGSIDHDSISAAREMKAACAILGMGATVGCELRVNFTGSSFEGYKLNNPDSVNIAYMTIHGVPEDRIDELAAFLAPVQVERGRRNRAQVAKLNAILASFSLPALDYEADVVPLSKSAEGGSVTERHILAALCESFIRRAGKGKALVDFLEKELALSLPSNVKERLLDTGNPHYLYDLLGVLKSSFMDRFFIQPDENECISAERVCAFVNSIQAIPAYAYLGDITESPTGDKKAEKFEDEFLEGLVPELKRLGFRAITYMPPRNTKAQLLAVQKLCAGLGLMEISGVDINSSRQSFNCPEVLLPEFRHLVDNTWALIAHEKLSGIHSRLGLFSPDNPHAGESLPERIRRYAAIGREIDCTDPESYVRKHHA